MGNKELLSKFSFLLVDRFPTRLEKWVGETDLSGGTKGLGENSALFSLGRPPSILTERHAKAILLKGIMASFSVP